MPPRLIIFVLLFTYGLPAVLGQGLHWLLPADAGPACSRCSCGHHSGPVRVTAAGRGPGAQRTSVDVPDGRSSHDCQSCLVCKQQRLAQSVCERQELRAAAALEFRWRAGAAVEVWLEPRRLSDPRGPPC